MPETKQTQEDGRARQKIRKTGMAWFLYFAAVIFCTFFPAFYPYHVVDPFILGIPVHLFKWFVMTILLVGGIIVFEFTVWWKWRGDDR